MDLIIWYHKPQFFLTVYKFLLKFLWFLFLIMGRPTRRSSTRYQNIKVHCPITFQQLEPHVCGLFRSHTCTHYVYTLYIYAAIYKTPHMVALFLTRDSPGSDPDDPEPHWQQSELSIRRIEVAGTSLFNCTARQSSTTPVLYYLSSLYSLQCSRSIEIILDKLPRHKIGRLEINGTFLCGKICPKLLRRPPMKKNGHPSETIGRKIQEITSLPLSVAALDWSPRILSYQ